MLKTTDNPTIYLEDYKPPEFKLISCELDFELDPAKTRVTARYEIESLSDSNTLKLDGEALELVSIQLDGKTVSSIIFRPMKHP